MHNADNYDDAGIAADGSVHLGGTGSKDRRIRIDSLSKMEGHANLDIKIKGGKVEYVKLKIAESKRFYTQAIRNKPAMSLPLMTSRVCGTCSIAHLTCCADAVEKSANYTPTEQTILLRKLSLYGMMIRDHALHLFMFCLPDLVGRDSVLDFDESQNEMLRKAFAIKSAGNNLSKVVAGRAVHATYAEVGRFSHIPQKEEVAKVLAELKASRDYVLEFIELFYDCEFRLDRDINFVSAVTKDYSFLGGDIEDSGGMCIIKERYKDYLDKIVIPYSEATGYSFKGREYMVGAIARMNLNKGSLHTDTRKDAAKYISAFPSKNIYHNNLAQAIEVLHCMDHSIELLEANEFKEENSVEVKIIEGEGIGLLEAPRGTLYYRISVAATGKTVFGDIIVPTQQNQVGMEKSVVELVEANIEKDRNAIEYEIEKLLRAYDPCMSCASHFLKINWR